MIADLARLTRVKLCLLAAAGAVAGHLLWRARPDWGMLLTAGGAFLLAAGCSALNQAQERRRDGAMTRTRLRPLPARRMGLAQVLALALAFVGSGLALLWSQGGPRPVVLGLTVIVLYNVLYTPLKGLTSFALLLGGVAGALPPVLGWLAAGGPWVDFRVVLVAVLFYLWQVPHFAFLARLHPEDYRRAGIPLAGLARTERRGHAPLMAWLACYCAAMTMVSIFDLVGTPLAKFFLAVLAVGLFLGGMLTLGRSQLGLRLVNASLLLFLTCMIVDALWLSA